MTLQGSTALLLRASNAARSNIPQWTRAWKSIRLRSLYVCFHHGLSSVLSLYSITSVTFLQSSGLRSGPSTYHNLVSSQSGVRRKAALLQLLYPSTFMPAANLALKPYNDTGRVLASLTSPGRSSSTLNEIFSTSALESATWSR